MASIFEKITDYLGRTIKLSNLTQEFAGITPTSSRPAFSESVISGLTPQKLGGIFKAAATGDNSDMLKLAADMEERDPHFGSVLMTRKMAVAGLDRIVEAYSDDTKHVEMADKVRELVNADAFDGLLMDLLDGLGKSYSLVEIVYATSKTEWTPQNYIWRDQTHFQWADDGRTLRMREEGNDKGAELPAGKFIIHIPKLKSGLPARAGLARLAAWSFMIKTYGLKDWAEFCESYGKPIRLGKYDGSATPEEKSALLRALRSIGKDFAAIVPESMEIEFVTSPAKTGGGLFKELLQYLDEQLSKAILGQTMTTDNGSSMAQAQVHNEVRKDIIAMDAKQLSATINRDLIKPYIDINFGVQENYPTFKLHLNEPEDLKALCDNIATLAPFGLTVETSVIRDKLGLPDPETGEGVELIGPIKTVLPVAKDDDTGSGKAKNKKQPCPSCGVAHNRTGDTANEDDIDELSNAGQDDWQEQLDPLLAPIRRMANSVSSYDDFIAALPNAINEADIDALASKMTRQMFKSFAHGDKTDVMPNSDI